MSDIALAPNAHASAPSLANPRDVTYQLRKQQQAMDIMREFRTPERIKSLLRAKQQQAAPRDETGGELTRQLLGEAVGALGPTISPDIQRNILGSGAATGLTDGSPLIRQDLEPVVLALYLTEFPLVSLLNPVPGNGLQHAYDVMTTPDPNMTTTTNTVSTVISELAAVNFTASVYNRKTVPFNIFAVGRGVSFLEMAAVRGGGMSFDPTRMELAGGVIKIAYDYETLMLQGNGSYAAGTAANEGGPYNNAPAYFDGMRVILGGVTGSNYAGNFALQMEQGNLDLTRTIKALAAKSAQQGGKMDIAIMSINGKEQLDQENEGNKRYNDSTVEILPGVQVNTIPWANGMLKVVPVPGFGFGTYTSPLSGQSVEDVYLIQSDTVERPWLYSEGLTVIELPAAVDYTLSQRYILFQIGSLAIKGQPFGGKVRRLAQ